MVITLTWGQFNELKAKVAIVQGHGNSSTTGEVENASAKVTWDADGVVITVSD